MSAVHALTGHLSRADEREAPPGTSEERCGEQGDLELGDFLGVFSAPTENISEGRSELLSFSSGYGETAESIVIPQVTSNPGVCSE